MGRRMAELDIQAQLAEAKRRKWDDRTLAQRSAELAQELLLATLKGIRSDELDPRQHLTNLLQLMGITRSD